MDALEGLEFNLLLVFKKSKNKMILFHINTY